MILNTVVKLHKETASIPDEVMIHSCTLEHKDFDGEEWMRLTDSQMVVANIVMYVKMFKEAVYKRALRLSYRYAKNILVDTDDEEFDENVSRMRSDLLEAEKKNPNNTNDVSKVFDELRQDAQNSLDGVVSEPVIDMGFIKGFQDHFTPIERGEYWTVAARTSVGKSSFVSQIVKQNLIRGKNIIIHPLESNIKEFCRQVAAQTAKLNYRDLNNANQKNIDLYFKTLDRLEEITGKQIHFYKDKNIDKLTAHNDAYFLRNGRPDLIVLDYIQLVQSGNQKDNRATRLGEATATMKDWAGRYDCCVIALAQINRSVEKEDRRPFMSDLKECGNIEEDSNRVTFLHMPNKNKAGRDQRQESIREIQLIEDKNRFGRPGSMDIRFHAETTSFYSLKKKEGKDY